MIQNQKHLIALVFAFFCFSCVNATQSVSTSSESTLSKSSSSSQSNGDLHGKFTLDSTKNTLNLANNQATFQDERSITYSLSGITSESGWFVLNKKGTFRNEASSFYFTAISVDFVVLSPFGSLLSKASNYAISSPANGAYPLVSGETLSFGSEEAFTYFSLFAPVGQFQINSITLSYDLGLSHEAKPLEQLDFYTVNDTHGASEEVVSSYHPGIEKLGQELRSQEQVNPDGSLVLSSGDMWQGSADSNMTKGLLMVDWMNGLGFESMAVGNHEFDWFPATIESNASEANFPFLGINIRDPSGVQPSWAKSSTTIERSGVKIGVIGAIGPVETSIAKSSLSGYSFASNYPSLIEQEALRLKQQENCALVVVSIHYGDLETSLCPDIDAVFEGHTHQNYEKIDTQGIPHVQTYANGSNIQHVRFSKQNGKFAFSTFESFDFATIDGLQKDGISSNIYAYYLSLVAEKKNEVVGSISTTWDKATIAALSAKRMYLDYKNDAWSKDLMAAFVNKGCARQEIPAGQVTYGQIYAALPFDNDLILFSTSGANLKSLLTDTYLSGYSEITDSSSLSDTGSYDIMMISYVSEQDKYAPNLSEISRDSVNRSRDLLANYLRSQQNG
jgi:2',3'-cyclic-nucleotide 2'-phosphodiesterase (5'-nucleotidase family)